MNRLRAVGCVVCLSLLLIVCLAADTASGPNLDGNYVLESRDLSDGTTLKPPQVIGMLTLANGRRNFNVYWTQDGKPVSIGIISHYTLSATEFAETNDYFTMNDGSSGKPPMYDVDGKTGKSPVKVDGDKVSFQLPLHGEPSVTFDGKGFTATMAGKFVDHWKKVE